MPTLTATPTATPLMDLWWNVPSIMFDARGAGFATTEFGLSDRVSRLEREELTKWDVAQVVLVINGSVVGVVGLTIAFLKAAADFAGNAAE